MRLETGDAARQFLQTGAKLWELPLEIDLEGRIAEQEGELTERARLVLEVVPGERRLQPDFGCRIHCLASLQKVGEQQLAAALIEEALARWIPQFGVERVDVLLVEGHSVAIALLAAGRRHELTFEHRPPGRPARGGGV